MALTQYSMSDTVWPVIQWLVQLMHTCSSLRMERFCHSAKCIQHSWGTIHARVTTKACKTLHIAESTPSCRKHRPHCMSIFEMGHVQQHPHLILASCCSINGRKFASKLPQMGAVAGSSSILVAHGNQYSIHMTRKNSVSTRCSYLHKHREQAAL